MYLGKNIRYLRTKKGYSQDYLAEKLGYKSFTTIQKWESGASEPPIKKLKELSEIFNVDMDDLNNIDLQANSSEHLKSNHSSKRGVVIPVLGSVAAGIPIEMVEDIVDTEEIPPEMAITGSFFGLRIKGDSMEPRICEGDVVIVRQQEDAESGDIVIACVNGDEATCKRLKKYEHGIALISNNTSYEPMIFSNEDIEKKPITILGKVVELRGKL